MKQNKYDPSCPSPEALAARYKGKFRQSAVSAVYDLMRKNDVSVEDIQAYVAKKDGNRSPLEKIREYKKQNAKNLKQQKQQLQQRNATEADSSSNGSNETSTQTPGKQAIVKSRPNPAGILHPTKEPVKATT